MWQRLKYLQGAQPEVIMAVMSDDSPYMLHGQSGGWRTPSSCRRNPGRCRSRRRRCTARSPAEGAQSEVIRAV